MHFLGQILGEILCVFFPQSRASINELPKALPVGANGLTRPRKKDPGGVGHCWGLSTQNKVERLELGANVYARCHELWSGCISESL